MNKNTLIGIALIILGILALGYENISYMTQEEVVDIGPLEVDVEKEKTISIPRLAGIVLLISGVITVAYTYMTSSRK